MQGFNYQHYTAVLTRAVQEQQGTIERLQGDLSADRQTVALRNEEIVEQRRELVAQKSAIAEQARELTKLRQEMAELSRVVSRLHDGTKSLP